MPKVSREARIRAYLAYLQDPGSAVDPETVAAAELAVKGATDPIDKVLALTHLEHASTADEPSLRAGFVADAAAWCEQRGVSVTALASFGVPREVLAEAGLTPPKPAVPAARSDLDLVDERLPRDKPFRASELAAVIGQPVERTRGYLARLISVGKVEDVGPDPNWTTQGRRPILYRATGGFGGESGI